MHTSMVEPEKTALNADWKVWNQTERSDSNQHDAVVGRGHGHPALHSLVRVGLLIRMCGFLSAVVRAAPESITLPLSSNSFPG